MSSTYAIGDIQGCYRSFAALLGHITFDPDKDRLWLVGDVVNRGPDSLSMLRWIYEHQQCVRMVLGNHDLALLAMAWGLRKPKALDTFDDILAADDHRTLLSWLRTQPVMVENETHVMFHAGVTPETTLQSLRVLARNIEQELRVEDSARALVAVALGKEPAESERQNRLAQGLKMLVNLRVVDASGVPDYTYKGPANRLDAGRQPWFAHLSSGLWPKRLVTGHWAALGLHITPHLTALDSGCVWGGRLSALRLEDEHIFSVPTQELYPLAPDED